MRVVWSGFSESPVVRVRSNRDKSGAPVVVFRVSSPTVLLPSNEMFCESSSEGVGLEILQGMGILGFGRFHYDLNFEAYRKNLIFERAAVLFLFHG